jgi:thiol-disulfide isomerase/thioredoxin
MKKKLLHYTKEILTFIVTITILSNIISLYKSSDLSKEKLSINTLELINHKQFTLKTNKPILIHFWATWCPTCRVEASNIETISNYYNTLTIAVKSGSDDEIEKFLKENNLTFKTINDNNSKLASKFNIAAFPTTFIYNKKAELVFSEVGYTSRLGLLVRVWWASL